MDDQPEGPQPDQVTRFLSLVRREMRASDVRVLPAGEEVASANTLSTPLSSGRLVVVFAESPSDREALVRRLEMLARTFEQSLQESRDHTPRPAPARSLKDELAALAARAQAVDAVVIDAHSPVVWGSAETPAVELPSSDASGVALAYLSRADLGPAMEAAQDEGDEPPAERPDPKDLVAVSARAVGLVRALPTIPSLHKGGRLHAVLREEGLGYLASSFAGIYVLVVVYASPFDELRAERAVTEALPRIERLVLALPPRDPPPAPLAGVVALRRGGRRR